MPANVVRFPLAAISFLIFGGLVAVNAQLSLRATSLLAASLGLVHGFLNGAGMRWSVTDFVAYLGLVTGVFVLVALLAALVILLRPPCARIAVRVAGS